MKMFIMGGTAESIEIIKHIKTEHPEIYTITSTTTEYGARLAQESGSDETIAKPLLKDERVDFICEGDYSKGSTLEEVVKDIIRLNAAKCDLNDISKQLLDEQREKDE